MDFNHRGIGQCGGIHQTKVNVPVDDARHDRARKLR
jgi:hypothetical protein